MRTHTHTHLLSPCTQSLNCKRICRRLTSDRFRLDNLAVSSSLAKTGSPSWSRRLPEVLHLEEASLRVPLSTLACQSLLSLCKSCLVCSETVSSTYDTEAAPPPWNLNNIITQHWVLIHNNDLEKNPKLLRFHRKLRKLGILLNSSFMTYGICTRKETKNSGQLCFFCLTVGKCFFSWKVG